MAKSTRGIFHTIFCICVIVYCISQAIYCIFINSLFGSAISFLLTAFFIILYLYLPYHNVHKMIKRYNELYHAEVETDVYFFDDYTLGVKAVQKTERPFTLH